MDFNWAKMWELLFFGENMMIDFRDLAIRIIKLIQLLSQKVFCESVWVFFPGELDFLG